MSARFFAAGLSVYDRKKGVTVSVDCPSSAWAQMIADGLNLIIDQVAQWSPGAAHVDILDGEVIDDGNEQKAIGWHDGAATHL